MSMYFNNVKVWTQQTTGKCQLNMMLFLPIFSLFTNSQINQIMDRKESAEQSRIKTVISRVPCSMKYFYGPGCLQANTPQTALASLCCLLLLWPGRRVGECLREELGVSWRTLAVGVPFPWVSGWVMKSLKGAGFKPHNADLASRLLQLRLFFLNAIGNNWK